MGCPQKTVETYTSTCPAAAAGRAIRPEGTRLLWADISGQQLAPYAKNALQRAVLALPGRPVTFLRDRIQLEQVTSMRDSYVNAFLIQSRGVRIEPCFSCLHKMSRDPSSYASPFPHCIRLPGHFGGCCGNCKWPDRAAGCSKRDEVENVWLPAPQRVSYAAAQPLALPAAGSRDDDPKPEPDDDDDNEMDLVPVVDDGLAGDGTAEDPLRLD
ncbi:hypothetical protein NCS52_00896600 [Fusarium sp. LHS14.1]|nr:hypothetical protein NCS52_00896600 [Fusarium sp. LHS14.1]